MIWIAAILLPIVVCDEAYLPQVTNDFPSLIGIERIKAWIDPNVDPCQNFYLHSCGGFREKYKDLASLEEDKSIDVMSLMGRASSLLVEMILKQEKDSLAKSAVETDIFLKTRDYYLSCSNAEIIEKRGFEPIRTFVQKLMEKWESSNLSILRIIGDLQASLGVSVFFTSTYTSVPTKNINDLSLQIVPVQAYDMNLQAVLKIFEIYRDNGVLPPKLDLNAIAAQVLYIEQRQAKFITRLNQLNRKEHPNLQFDVSQLSYKTGLEWQDYLYALKLTDVTDIHLWADKGSWVSEIKYITSLPRQILLYYTLWRLAASHFNKLSEPYYSIWKDDILPKAVDSNVFSVDAAETRLRQDCIKETGINLKYLAGHLYVKYAFNETQKGSASAMVDRMFYTLRKRLIELEWMDLKSKSAAIRKLDNMVKIVGFPGWILDPYKVAQYYRPLKFKPYSYFENAVQAQIFTELMPSIRHSRTRDIERRDLFKDHMWMLNAVHLINLVQIQINTGFIQRPLFSSLNPTAMNYGSLGAVIGHEITHAFDSYGSQFDSEGVKRPWMTKSVKKIFEEKAECFVDQYDKIMVSFESGVVVPVDGRKTLTENIADNGGMHTAFDAWRSTETSDIYQKQDKEDFSPAQIFWLAYAQTHCEVVSDERLTSQLAADEHAPKVARVNGAVSNSAEFAKAFRCPLPTPTKQCRIL